MKELSENSPKVEDHCSKIHPRKQIKENIKMLRSFSTATSSISSVKQLLISRLQMIPTKDALYIPSKTGTLKWNITELAKHSGALSSGLTDLGLSNKSILSYLGEESVAESLTLSYGGLFSSARVSQKESISTLIKDIEAVKPSAIFVEAADLPNLRSQIPELESLGRKSKLSLEKYPYLKYIFQTGSESVNGTNRFRDAMLYYHRGAEVEASDGEIEVGGKVYKEKELLTESMNLAKELRLEKGGKLILDKVFTKKLFLASIACLGSYAKLIIPDSTDASWEETTSTEKLDMPDPSLLVSLKEENKKVQQM
eukprot:maker-scaffold_11-snap-gene-5.9-mRNA-1 protein AED:0.13 eAED:0.13 QI:249/1/1/1/0.5/0.33/3/438/311